MKICYIILMLVNISLAPATANGIPDAHLARISFLVKTILHGDKADSITPLSGGFSSPGMYKISVKGQSYVVRFSNDQWTKNDREREIHAMKIGSDLGLAPKLLYEDARDGVILMAYLDKETPAPWLNLTDAYINRVAKRMRHLHDGPAFKPYGSIFDSIREVSATLKGDRLDLIQRALALNTKLEEELQEKLLSKPCHNDLHPDNTIDVGDQIYFIDWEEAGPGDPFRDLATYALYAAMTPAQERTFLKAYLDHEPSAQDIQKYYKVKQLTLIYYALVMIMLAQQQGHELPDVDEITQLPALQDTHPSKYFADGGTFAILRLAFILLQEAMKA